MLLEVMEAYLSGPVRAAGRFWRTVPDSLGFDELLAKYPRGSEEFEHISTMTIFWETIGSLAKHGLLSEELAFDTFLDAPPWKKLKRFSRERRERERNPLEGENLEYIYKRSLEWKKIHARSRLRP